MLYFPLKLFEGNIMQTTEKKILSRVYGNGRGWAFSQIDFVDIAKTATIHWAMHRLVQEGTIRRVLRGIYDYPRYSDLLQKPMPPDIHKVARALERKFGWRIQPGGAVSLNLMGISTQVPSKFVYLSDGPNRKYQVGKTTLMFKHQALKEAALSHEVSAILVQGLKELGKNHVNEEVLNIMRNWLPENKRTLILKDTKGVTGWVYDALKRICREEIDG